MKTTKTCRRCTPISRSRTRSSPASRAEPARARSLSAGVGEPRYVLGVDPGTRLAGYALLECRQGRLYCRALGVVRLPVSESLPNRLARLGLEIARLARRYRPDAVAVEQAIYAQNVRTALALGQARGVVVGAAALLGAPVFEYAPRAVKRAVTGGGAASKAQVQGMVRRLLALDRLPSADEADAAALALCHVFQQNGARRALQGGDPAQGAAPASNGRHSSRWTARDVERLRAAGRIR